MTINKELIKEELIKIANDLLINYSEPDFVENISIMRMGDETTFLGSLKVFDEKNLNPIKSELEKQLKSYGKLTIRDQKVVPCCAPKHFHISFNISITD